MIKTATGIIAAAAAAVALAGCGGGTSAKPAPTVTVTRPGPAITVTVTASPSPSASRGPDLAADEKSLISDGTISTACTDASDGALTRSQQESYVYETADTPGQFPDGDVLTPAQARAVIVAGMRQVCPQLAGDFTFNP
jgi:hypothetical protein